MSDSVTRRPGGYKAQIDTSRRDVSHVIVEIVDQEGLVVPTANVPVAFTIEGAGRILGLDNGDPESHESFVETHRNTFNGLALVLLQSNRMPGSMRLSASAVTLKGAEVTVVTA